MRDEGGGRKEEGRGRRQRVRKGRRRRGGEWWKTFDHPPF